MVKIATMIISCECVCTVVKSSFIDSDSENHATLSSDKTTV